MGTRSLSTRRVPGSPDDSGRLRVAVLVATLSASIAALAGAAPTDLAASAALWIVCLVAVPVGSLVSWRLRHAWPAFLTPVATVLVLAVFSPMALSLRGDGATGASIRVGELLLLVVAIRSFDLRTRRDLWFALASATALAVFASSVPSGHGTLIALATWAAATVAALATIQREEIGAPPTTRREVAVVAGTVCALGVALSFALPGIDVSAGSISGAAGAHGKGGDGAPSVVGYSGLAMNLDTAARPQLDATPVMRVRARRADYWRGQTYDRWDGRRWSLASITSRPLPETDPLTLPDIPGEGVAPGIDILEQTYEILDGAPNLLFGAPGARSVSIRGVRIGQLGDGTLWTSRGLPVGSTYSVTSTRAPVTGDDLRTRDDPAAVPASVRSRYLQLPPSTTERVQELAREITRDERTNYDRVIALERWIAANTRYSLEFPPLGDDEDAVDRFLFADRVGFCEQIGSSLVVMLRSLGIPARLAAGFAPGTPEPGGTFLVEARDAHAWAEVYFPGVGWQGFDPTAGVPLASALPEPITVRTGSGRRGIDLSWTLVLAGAVLVLAVVVLVTQRRRLVRRRPSWAQATTREIERLGARAGRPRIPEETLAEYVAALHSGPLRDPRLRRVAAVVDADCFAPGGAGPGERERADALLRDVRLAVRGRADRPRPA